MFQKNVGHFVLTESAIPELGSEVEMPTTGAALLTPSIDKVVAQPTNPTRATNWMVPTSSREESDGGVGKSGGRSSGDYSAAIGPIE